ILGANQGRRGAQAYDEVRLVALVRSEPLERVSDVTELVRLVGGVLGRTHERCLGAMRPPDRRVLLRVRREHHACDEPALLGNADRPAHERLADQWPNVLARYPLRARPSANYAEYF